MHLLLMPNAPSSTRRATAVATVSSVPPVVRSHQRCSQRAPASAFSCRPFWPNTWVCGQGERESTWAANRWRHAYTLKRGGNCLPACRLPSLTSSSTCCSSTAVATLGASRGMSAESSLPPNRAPTPPPARRLPPPPPPPVVRESYRSSSSSSSSVRTTTTTTTVGQGGDTTVRAMQLSLQDKGYYKGPIDGLFTPATQDAMVRFQRATHLAEGRLTPETAHALGLR